MPPSEHFWGSQRGDLCRDAVTSWTLQHQRDLQGAELRQNASQCRSTYTLPLLFLTILEYANMNDFSPLSVTSLSHHRWYFNPFSWWVQIWHDALFVERDLLTIYLPAVDVEEFVEWIWSDLALYLLLTNGSSAVNGCRQNESLNSW